MSVVLRYCPTLNPAVFPVMSFIFLVEVEHITNWFKVLTFKIQDKIAEAKCTVLDDFDKRKEGYTQKQHK